MDIDKPPKTLPQESEPGKDELPYSDDEIEASDEMRLHKARALGLPDNAPEEEVVAAEEAKGIQDIAIALGLPAGSSHEEVLEAADARGLQYRLHLVDLGLGFDATRDQIEGARALKDFNRRRLLAQVAREMQARGVQKSQPAPRPEELEPQEAVDELPYGIGQILASEEMFLHDLAEAGLPPDASSEDLNRAAETKREQARLRILQTQAIALGLPENASHEEIYNSFVARGLEDKKDLPLLGLSFDATDDEIKAARMQTEINEERASRALMWKIVAQMQANGVEPEIYPEATQEEIEKSDAAIAEKGVRSETEYMAGKITRLGPGYPALKSDIEVWEKRANGMVVSEAHQERFRVFVQFQRVRLSIAMGDIEDALRRLEEVISQIESSPNAEKMRDILEKARHNLTNTRRNILAEQERKAGENKA